MPNIGPLELGVILLIVLLIFGPKRLPGLGKQLGTGMREFKDSISGKDKDKDKDIEEESDEHADAHEALGRPALARAQAAESEQRIVGEPRVPGTDEPVESPGSPRSGT
jgi:sec-independent protein translocase protein TatA